jgi:hypothetical protein
MGEYFKVKSILIIGKLPTGSDETIPLAYNFLAKKGEITGPTAAKVLPVVRWRASALNFSYGFTPE